MVSMSEDKQYMCNINFIAMRSWAAATKRGQINDRTCHDNMVRNIKKELKEFAEATPGRSEHLPEYSEQEEELADIILVCLTSLAELGTNVAQLLIDKTRFNFTRKD